MGNGGGTKTAESRNGEDRVNMNFTITAKTSPECQNFLKIIEGGQQYRLEEFAENHKGANVLEFDNAVKASSVLYRGVEKKYADVTSEYVAFSESLPFFEFNSPMMLLDSSDRAAIAFVKSARECLQNARYFTMKSADILDTNDNINWSGGYLPQFGFRTINFSTAVSWYSNCFDQILQIAYWGYSLFASARDRGGVYDPSWDVERVLKCCTYGFVKSELHEKGLVSVEDIIADCMVKIQDVRDWGNFIKHKGGIDYKYIEAPSPVQIRVKMGSDPDFTPIDDYVSPIAIDIDDKITSLTETHGALLLCLTKVVQDIDFDARAVNFHKQEGNPNE
jgi:hypothetical protein